MSRAGRRKKIIDPKNWASLKPFGIGEGRPNNYLRGSTRFHRARTG